MQNSNMYFENKQGNHHTLATQKPPNQEVSLGKKLPTSSHVPLSLHQISNNVPLIFLAQDPESHASFSCPSVSSSFGLKESLVSFSLLTLINGRGRGSFVPQNSLMGSWVLPEPFTYPSQGWEPGDGQWAPHVSLQPHQQSTCTPCLLWFFSIRSPCCSLLNPANISQALAEMMLISCFLQKSHLMALAPCVSLACQWRLCWSPDGHHPFVFLPTVTSWRSTIRKSFLSSFIIIFLLHVFLCFSFY